MNVAVAVLDHDHWGACADVIVLVQSAEKCLTWIPRDLWCPLLGDRINSAISMGRSGLLGEALRSLGFACESVLCLRRGATEAALQNAEITVPIPDMLAFWYASEPSRAIEDGRKLVAFAPPRETLRGERIHQWLTARYMVNGTKSDLHRIERQQTLLRAMLEADFDFGLALQDPERFESCGADPMPALRVIDRTWAMTTFLSVAPKVIDGKAVLVRRQIAAGSAGEKH